jgi:hypothetical protein
MAPDDMPKMTRNSMERISIYREANRQAAAVIVAARERYPRIMQIWAEHVLNPELNKPFPSRNGLPIPEPDLGLDSTIDGRAGQKRRRKEDLRS